MKNTIEFKKDDAKILFGDLKDKKWFYSGGVLYMKILQQDLNHYNIKNINAISVLNAGLTFFEHDEIINTVSVEYKN